MARIDETKCHGKDAFIPRETLYDEWPLADGVLHGASGALMRYDMNDRGNTYTFCEDSECRKSQLSLRK